MRDRFVIKLLLIGLSCWFFGGIVLANDCPTDNGAGVGCAGETQYYCNNSCRAGASVDWCSTLNSFEKTPLGNCYEHAPGCDDNCSGSDGCGICNQCDSGYLLCSGTVGNKCAPKNSQTNGVGVNCTKCTWNSADSYTCTACAPGYTLASGQCVAAVNSPNQLMTIIVITLIGGLILIILLLLK